MKFVQAGQILNFLGASSPSASKICSWLSKSKDTSKVEIVFYRAEAQRLFGCSDKKLDSEIRDDV